MPTPGSLSFPRIPTLASLFNQGLYIFSFFEIVFQEIEDENAKHFKEEENEKQDADEVINSSIEDKGI